MKTELEFRELDLKNTCRTCLFQCAELNSIFEVSEIDEKILSEILMACSETKISAGDGLPEQICTECTKQVVNAYNFKLKCQESENFLLNYVEKYADKPEENKIEPNLNIKTELYEEPLIPTLNKSISQENIDKISDNGDPYDANDSYHSENEAKDKKKFPCEFCNKIYAHKKSLTRHLKTHPKKNLRISTLRNKDANAEHSSNLVCTYCREKFPTKLRILLHKCSFQNISTIERDQNKDSVELNEAVCMPNGLKIIECKICKEKFTKIYNLKSHMNVHTDINSFENCGFNMNDFLKSLDINETIEYSEIVEYIITEIRDNNFSKFYSILNKAGYELSLSDSETESDTDEVNAITHKLYICEICKKSFDRRYKMLFHQKSDHVYDELLEQCQYCFMKFCNIQLLEYHLKTQCENYEKQFNCDECNMKYFWRQNLSEHINIQHTLLPSSSSRKVKKKNYICGICKKLFSRQEHLDRHMNIHQPDDKKFECVECHKKFNRKDNMKSHMKIHREDRDKDESDKQLCVYCGRRFSNSSNLIVHMRRHTGEKPYKCDICDKGFPRSSDLQCHRRTHTGEKPCLCTICGKGFSRSNKLVRHMRIHTGVRPYKCTYCERAFTQSNDLTLHIRRHTGDKPYVCGICGDRFIQGTALQTHRRMKGHYEEGNREAPYSSISVNNPNRMNFANRVDRIGLPKTESVRPLEIKPVGRGNSRLSTIPIGRETEQNVSSPIDSIRNVIPASETLKNLTSFIQPNTSVSGPNSSAYPPNVPFMQFGENELFSISNMNYNQPFQ